MSVTRDPRGAVGPPVRPRPPLALQVLLVLVVLEAVLLVVLAGQGLVALLTDGSSSVGVTVFLLVFAVAVAAALLLAARALLAGRRGGRAPVVTWQLLQAATALTLLPSGVAMAWPALVAAVVVVVLMMTRPVVEHTVPAARR